MNHSGSILQFGEYVHILLMISVLFHANIFSLCSYCAHGSHNLYSAQYHVFHFCVYISLKLVTCTAFCAVITTLGIGITFMVPTGVRIHHVVRVKTPCSLIESVNSLMVAVCMGR